MQHKFSILIALCVVVPTIARAQESDRAKTEFFEAKIRPALVAHCYECHSTKSGKARGSLKVDSRDALLAGGDSGPAVVASSLEKSLLYKAITHDGDYQMPPKGKLPDDVIADFRKWILMGAPDPRVAEISPTVKTVIDVEKGREYWAYRPLVQSEPPKNASSSWARTPIDQFILAKLDKNKLQPVADASPRLLVRRLYFVLIGLPPTPEEIDDWTKRIETQPSEQARQQVLGELVDRLLESPQYGERWGRHWMDVARFAESTGGDQNNVFQHAWRYRDWVIDAFNSDKPFEQFIREQIAGDLLPIANDQEWADNVIATGFLAVGTKLVGEEDQQKFFADLVDEQIDATTRSFLATSVSCARCHDHKFDPIPQSDYYALAGIFRSTETHYGLLKAQARQATTLLDLSGLGPPPGRPALNKEELAKLIQARNDARQTIDDAMRKIRAGENVFRGLLRKYRSDRDETEAALQSYTPAGEPRVFAMGTQDRDLPLATRLLVRGELDKPAQNVSRGVLQVLSPRGKHSLPTTIKGSGRLELANWIASNENPLTARVMSNRVWHWMFGRGIVRTVDDFGSTGDRPTHPELLDYLANRFIQNGWSTKKLIREIALSRTWQLSTSFDENNFAVDPDNQYLWRMHQRRLEAEAVRDAMLVIGGNLDLKRQPGTLLREAGEGNVGLNVFEPVIRAIDSNRRSVYLPRVRGVLPEVLELFDAPDASLVAGSREQTSSPLQSLFLMNNPFVQRQAEGLAKRVAKRPSSEQIDYAYRLTLGRMPRAEEKQLANSFMNDVGSARLSTQQKLTAYCQALICTTEFSSID
jgi:cytochrome c553